jgi:hypothetical protein
MPPALCCRISPCRPRFAVTSPLHLAGRLNPSFTGRRGGLAPPAPHPPRPLQPGRAGREGERRRGGGGLASAVGGWGGAGLPSARPESACARGPARRGVGVGRRETRGDAGCRCWRRGVGRRAPPTRERRRAERPSRLRAARYSLTNSIHSSTRPPRERRRRAAEGAPSAHLAAAEPARAAAAARPWAPPARRAGAGSPGGAAVAAGRGRRLERRRSRRACGPARTAGGGK